MITAVNTLLSAIAFSDLIVNLVTIPYLVHEVSDSHSNPLSDYLWAIYTLCYAHVSVTAHALSIWLTCTLATWRYFVVW